VSALMLKTMPSSSRPATRSPASSRGPARQSTVAR
jgi:hypothetical protein